MQVSFTDVKMVECYKIRLSYLGVRKEVANCCLRLKGSK